MNEFIFEKLCLEFFSYKNENTFSNQFEFVDNFTKKYFDDNQLKINLFIKEFNKKIIKHSLKVGNDLLNNQNHDFKINNNSFFNSIKEFLLALLIKNNHFNKSTNYNDFYQKIHDKKNKVYFLYKLNSLCCQSTIILYFCSIDEYSYIENISTIDLKQKCLLKEKYNDFLIRAKISIPSKKIIITGMNYRTILEYLKPVEYIDLYNPKYSINDINGCVNLYELMKSFKIYTFFTLGAKEIYKKNNHYLIDGLKQIISFPEYHLNKDENFENLDIEIKNKIIKGSQYKKNNMFLNSDLINLIDYEYLKKILGNKNFEEFIKNDDHYIINVNKKNINIQYNLIFKTLTID